MTCEKGRPDDDRIDDDSKKVIVRTGPHLSTDTGGTFTDFVYLDSHGVKGYKLLSTPNDPSICIEKGVKQFPVLGSFSHGTTVATNAVLERKGDRTALVTTRGFRDVIFIGRQRRQHLYSFHDLRPAPLIGRKDVFEITERVDRDGNVITPIDDEEVRKLALDISRLGYTSAAVVFLFSFLNPDHEERVSSILEEQGIHVSRSSVVLPEYREYERTSTTLLDAYIRKRLGGYLSNLDSIMKDHGLQNYHVMESEGGVAPWTTINRIPSKGLLSGPAGGVSGAVQLGADIGIRNMITLDMGGTSTDVARITDLIPEYTTESRISGLPLSRRNLDIVTIGAGGGSIAAVDIGGAIMVGPESAGAHPGPVCYGLGGQAVTVTDVNLLAGYLNPMNFLGEGKHLAVTNTRTAVEKLAQRLGFTLDETIQGVRKVVNHTMAAALRMVTTEAGKDPKEYALVAFGGAGPIHSVELARELGMRKVIVPVAAGMFSAYGILISDVLHSFSRTKVMHIKEPNLQVVSGILDAYIHQGAKNLAESGIPDSDHRFLPSVDVRYCGQSWFLNIPFSQDIDTLERSFRSSYLKKFGYTLDGDMEIVNIRLEARGKRFIPPKSDLPSDRGSEPYEMRNCLFDEWEEVPVYRREGLGSGFSWSGACIIEDNGSTIVIPPGSRIGIDTTGTLEVRT